MPEPVGVDVTEPMPATARARKRRRAARREPTPGQAAQQRSARREAEAREAQETDTAPHAGAEVEDPREPWEGYDALSAADVVQRLVDVDNTTRAAVRLYENTHEGREAILHATD